jgi:hypothetical protein
VLHDEMRGEMSGEKTDTTHISSEFPIKSKKRGVKNTSEKKRSFNATFSVRAVDERSGASHGWVRFALHHLQTFFLLHAARESR